MHALILTEGSREWGSGHLLRCLSFAQYLKAKGIEVFWLLKGDSIADAFLTEVQAGELCDWFSLDLLESRLKGCFLVIVDSYHAPRAVYELLFRRVTHCLWIDDDGRLDYPEGFVLNPNPPTSLEAWRTAHPATRLLSGYADQSLRVEFWDVQPRTISTTVRRVLIMMGGTDPHGLMPRVIDVVRREYPRAHVDAVVPDITQRSALWRLPDDLCTLHGRLGGSEVRELMEDADLAVLRRGRRSARPAVRFFQCQPFALRKISSVTPKRSPAPAQSGLPGWHGDERLWGTLALALREQASYRSRQALSDAGRRLMMEKELRK